ncbi:patatin-like phospholipase family protein [Bosea sp. (in: a-proteobacteria)]|jgi:NTE family protein|uniref:patatin-like phospholipase family protein n=1 Tax=Bosea sp. (in: a-proteobacteria) TaxID=1871050 RepID=UPI002DDD0725|nr:patatin-like phospholipase family protein [Bosea sp. (in: a-proteobacteria)]HEV2509228.1 patatin-like phospholipase family protein [Bosea sp. (in: a-proteobacteria)]
MTSASSPLARLPNPSGPELVLVLGSGGARGLSHIPVLEALDELGLKPALIAGSSMGAIVGAAYAAGLSGRDLRAHVEASFRDRARVIARLLEARIGKIADLWRGGLGNPVLIDGERLLDLFWPQAVPDRFEELGIPFLSVATDYHLHDEVILGSGPLTPAVAASLAIPGLIKPVTIGGRVLIDGGAINPLPYDRLLGPGRLVLAVDTSAPATVSDSRVPEPLEAMVGVSQILTRALVQRMIERQPPDILIRAGGEGFGGLDFFRWQAILEAAEPAKEEVKRRLSEALERAA